MNWQEIKVSADKTHFLSKGIPIFGRQFLEVQKFHAPGLAPVIDKSGSYHIDASGKPLYAERYSRTFGYYCNRAAVVEDNQSFHLTEQGIRAYMNTFSWTGNYQENLCPVRDNESNYYHIDPDGKKIYEGSFLYCGDFKDGFSCVKRANGLFSHIDMNGGFLNGREFLDLDVFHKSFAMARDDRGWHHIDKYGNELYKNRYLFTEPFYNGYALVTMFDYEKIIIDEEGNQIVRV